MEKSTLISIEQNFSVQTNHKIKEMGNYSLLEKNQRLHIIQNYLNLIMPKLIRIV